MATKKKEASEKGKQGRPTRYRKEYDHQALRHCLLGSTDAELAELFGMSIATIYNWKNKHPSFVEAIKEGRENADARVAQALYHKALGYTVKRQKPMVVSLGQNAGSEVKIVEYDEEVASDTAAAFIWLKNRKKLYWRDRHEITGADGGPIQLQFKSSEDEQPI